MKHSRCSFIPNVHDPLALYLILGGGLVLSMAANIAVGAVALSPKEVLQALLGLSPSENTTAIVLYFRLPRCFGAVLAGAALAVSGAIIQSVLANPLAGPNIIGVNSGAGVMVAAGCALFPAAAWMSPLLAFLGAFAGVLLVLGISERTGASRMSLILSGIAISNIFSACIDTVVTLVPEALNAYSDFRIGGLRGITMPRLLPAAVIIAVGLTAALSLAKELEILSLGTETAQSLGLDVKKLRILLLMIAAALAGAAVSFCGLLGFVGLIVPHILRRISGGQGFPLLLGSALGGAILLSVCDLLARVLFAPHELAAGIVMSFVGGPFFIWLLFHQKGGRTHG